MPTKTSKPRKKVPPRDWYEKAANDHGRTILTVSRAQQNLAAAQREAHKAEAELVRAAKYEAQAGNEGAQSWLIWWWNNGETSPRGQSAASMNCVMDWSEIPADAQPVI